MKREINRAINEALSGIYDDWCLQFYECDGCDWYDYATDTGSQCFADGWRQCPGVIKSIAKTLSEEK